MKVALLADTHWGVRNDAPEFLNMTKRFLDDVFFPRLDRDGIKLIVHLGDLFDRRKYANFNTLNRLRTDFMDPLDKRGIKMDLILGNHDVYHKNTNELNAPTELYRRHPAILNIHSETTEISIDQLPVLYVPWITPENHDETMDRIRHTRAQVCFGHLELEGFEMYRGQVMGETGLSPRLFDKFDVTCSGHFHRKSTNGSINYLGSHGEFTWSDYNDERGFHIFDTETRELEFIENPYTMFEKLTYDDAVHDHGIDRFSFPYIEQKHVKVIVKNKKDLVKFEQFISYVEELNPVSVQVVDDHLNAGDVLDVMEEVDESEDTLTIFRKALAAGDYPTEQMDAFVTELYTEALMTGD